VSAITHRPGTHRCPGHDAGAIAGEGRHHQAGRAGRRRAPAARAAAASPVWPPSATPAHQAVGRACLAGWATQPVRWRWVARPSPCACHPACAPTAGGLGADLAAAGRTN
jgi:hypothetical protein